MDAKAKKNLLIVGAVFLALAILGSALSQNQKKSSGSAREKQTSASAGPELETSGPKRTDYVLKDEFAHLLLDQFNSALLVAGITVTNTGETDLYLPSCTIDVEDENGKLFGTVSSVTAYPQIIKPGESGYYYGYTLYDGPLEENLRPVPHVQPEKAHKSGISLPVIEPEIKVSAGRYHFTGRVRNDSGQDQSMVYVVVNLFDSKDRFIGRDRTILHNTLAAGDTVGFDLALYPPASLHPFWKYEIIAFPYTFQF